MPNANDTSREALFQNTILRLGEGAYIFFSPETQRTYSIDVTRSEPSGRLEIYESDSVIVVDSPAFPLYILGLVLQGVVLTGTLPVKEPIYIPLKV